ncbi:MAG TPA: hypothetical protein VGD84_15790 [Pseudonocardiaceae bacterium]
MTSLPATPPPHTDTPIYDDLVRAIPQFGTEDDRSDMPSDEENPPASTAGN